MTEVNTRARLTNTHLEIPRRVDSFENAVQRLEARVILPAVHVLSVEVKDGLVELDGHIAGDQVLPDPDGRGGTWFHPAVPA